MKKMKNIKTKIKQIQHSIKGENTKISCLKKIHKKYPNVKISDYFTTVNNNFEANVYFWLEKNININISKVDLIDEPAPNNHVRDNVIAVGFSFSDVINGNKINFESFDTINLLRYNTYNNKVLKFYKFESKLKRMRIPNNVIRQIKLSLVKEINNFGLILNLNKTPDFLKPMLMLA